MCSVEDDAVDSTLPEASRRHTVIVVKRFIAKDREPSMQSITTVGLDLAKSKFQVHGLDAEDNVVLRRQINRKD